MKFLFPGFLIIPLFLLNSASEGEERTDTEVVVILESSGKLSVSFSGPRLTDMDWILLGIPLGNVVATCTLFVSLTEELWRAVELLSSSMLLEAKMEKIYIYAARLLKRLKKSGMYPDTNNVYYLVVDKSR